MSIKYKLEAIKAARPQDALNKYLNAFASWSK